MSTGMVNIEINVGSMVKGALPIRIENGSAFVDQFNAEVIEIKKIIATAIKFNGRHAYKIDLRSINGTTPWVIDYRIFSFTFGGLELIHSKWDMKMIDAENRNILKRLTAPTQGTVPAP